MHRHTHFMHRVMHRPVDYKHMILLCFYDFIKVMHRELYRSPLRTVHNFTKLQLCTGSYAQLCIKLSGLCIKPVNWLCILSIKGVRCAQKIRKLKLCMILAQAVCINFLLISNT